jgi:large subunit ribosomal protein L18
LILIQSRRNRLIIRCSLKHATVQVAESLLSGDKILAQSHSKQLVKEFDWKLGTGNIPAAYLTGYLCGKRAIKAGIADAILDIGILVHDQRVKAAFKGFLDAGVDVNHDEAWFPESLATRISGAHIQEYATALSKDDSKKYKQIFSAVLKQKGDPTKYVSAFDKLKADIEKKVK